jgi:hypothetical protein
MEVGKCHNADSLVEERHACAVIHFNKTWCLIVHTKLK